MREMPQDPEDERAEDESGMCSRAAENDKLEWGGGQLLGKGGVAIFNQDSMKTAVISPALHKQGAKTRVAFAIKTDFFKNNMSIKDYFRHQLNDGENNK